MAIAEQKGSAKAGGKSRRSSSFIQQARQLHLYMGTFFAPAILFFAITGALQTFSFHERTRGSSYDPPVLLMKLAQLHKKQTLAIAPKKPTPEEANRPQLTKPPTTLVMK